MHTVAFKLATTWTLWLVCQSVTQYLTVCLMVTLAETFIADKPALNVLKHPHIP